MSYNANVAKDKGSFSQYVRLFESLDLSVDLVRVLYLNSDIIVKRLIRELWNIDL